MEKLQIENFTFYNADNLEIMRCFKDNEFDLAIVDPPYGINGKFRTYHSPEQSQKHSLSRFKNCDWDNFKPTIEYIKELQRISKNQIIWGGNYFTEMLPYSRCWIVWDKMTYIPSMSQIELAYTSFDKNSQLVKYNSSDANRIHPTQKPIDLYDWIITKYANENDKIIDTHLGSGSIAIAIDKANTLDKKNLTFVGIELDPDYYRAAVERFKIHKMQKTLF